jgi:hypothetical protein
MRRVAGFLISLAAGAACLASRPARYDASGDRWGKEATAEGRRIACRFAREPEIGGYEVELAIGAP